MMYLWPVALQALAFAVLFAEVLIPSFGVLALIALALGVWSWQMILNDLPTVGVTVFALADALLLPLAIRYGFRYLGRSPVSHLTNVGSGSGLEETSLALEAHVGAVAEAETSLRPSGKVRIGETIHEAHTAGDFVEKGAAVRLVAVRGAEYLVEKI